jgi:hypothetical protein
MVNCDVCGHVNPVGVQYCENCGVELRASVAEVVTPVVVPVAVPVTPAVVETPALETSVVETPALETPIIETPVIETPIIETPVIETPVLETPPLEMPILDLTVTETPVVATPVLETPPLETSVVETPPLETPVVAATVPVVEAEVEAGVGSSETLTPAKLGIKKFGSLTGESIPLLGAHMTVGRFDPSSGPVDIDVSTLAGAEHISRRHAEMFFADGVWQVRDLGSTNGVFIKAAGQAAFSPRLQAPYRLNNGDEIAFGNMILVFQAG